MADAGGGKIRTRRYHTASKPYAKGKQQQGIIGRVTDTVKNIVPGWLQKYFKNDDPSAEAGDVEETADGRENHDGQIQNNQGHTDEEMLPFPDRRHTPEPSTSNAEPSTSQSALNFSIQPRPPLNRSHLNFATLNSPALHCQPSTSTAFPIGSSGFSLIKEIKDSTSQHEDDNISTTSGFSSRASDKDVTTSKNMLPVWSPEAERSQSVLQQAGTSLRKPAFNLSVFGGSSTSLASTSALNSSQLGDSLFYPGKTTYGGAAAVRTPSSRVRGTPYQAPVRRQVKAKQIHSPCGVTSATARRILQSLERMSSPLADAKRIPSPSSLPVSPMLNRGELEVIHFKSKRKSDAQHPPVQKLVTPKAASVAVNRSMFFKPSLTPTGHSSRSTDRGGRQTKQVVEPEISMQHPKSTNSFSYPLFSTPAANGMASGGAGGKMKRERGIRASSKPAQDQEQVEIPNLSHISLPMRISTLPTLNFSSPTNTSPSVTTTPVANKVPPAESSIQNRTDFTFSSPIFKATETSPLPLTPSAGFTFSAPVSKTVASDPSGTASTPSATPVKNSSTSSSAVGTLGNTNDEDFDGPFRPARALKQGSVLDILKGPDFSSSPPARSLVKPFQMSSTSSPTGGFGFGDKFKPATGSWQCDACLLQNKPTDSKCVACQTAKPNIDSSKQSKCSKTTSETLPSLGDKFKPVSGTWECDTCLVQNKPEVTKCVACETSKPGTGVKSALTLPAFSESKLTVGSGGSGSTSITTTTSSLSSGFGFGEKFKKPEGAWDCDVCLVQNKAEDIKCVSCQCAKPGAVAVPSTAMTAPEPSGGLLGFGDIFKKPEGSWDCDVCAVQNKAEVMQCVACQSAKPGAKVETKGFSSSALSSATTASPFGGITGGFKFGDQGGIKFGTSTTDNASSGGGFKFGMAKSEESRKPDSQTIGSGFRFGTGGGIQFGTGNSSSQSENKAAEPKGKPSLEGFTFGLSAPPKADEKTADGGFKFGAPKEKPELGGTAAAMPFSFGKQEEKKLSGEQLPAVGFAFGKPVEEKTGTLAPAAASTFMLGKTDKPDSVSSSSNLIFGKGKETDKPATQLGFSFGKPEPTKEEAKPAFSFGKPAEKQEAAVQPKPAFAFGAAPPTADQGASKPAYNFMASTTASATVTAASTTSSTPSTNMFGSSSTSTSIAPVSTFMFGQASSTGFASGASETTTCSKSFMFGAQESKAPAAPAAGASPFMFVTGSNTAATAFGFGSTASAAPTTTSSTGSSASQFVFGSASSTPASALAFGNIQTPAFGHGSNQPSAPAFGSPPAAAVFSAGSQPPAFGSQASTSQPSVFGQQSNQLPAFGAAVAASAAPAGGFQFGATSNFGTPSSSGVFAFGGSAGGSSASAVAPAAPAQPSGSTGGFQFSQAPGFNIGSTKTTSTGSSQGQHQISGRKIKTAVRRRK